MNKRIQAGVVVVATLVASAVIMTPAYAAGCFGRRATIVGTNGNDRIRGTSGSDVILGRGGDDLIRSQGGKDLICGGSGNDAINAATGKDKVNGGSGDDALDGWSSNDVVLGGAGVDLMFGGKGNDLLVGAGGVDLMRAQGGNDRVRGEGATDLLIGDEGNDVLDGGPDLDLASFFFNQAGVTADLTAGTATSAYSGTDTLAGIEGLEGSNFDDGLTGNAVPNLFAPGPGNDAMNGADGVDAVVYLFSTVAVTANLGAGTVAAEGTDTVSFIEEVAGSEFNDSLTGGTGPDILFGFLGNDMLSGLDGDDVLDGFDGTDTADGGTHVAGDRCLNVESHTNCELFARSGSRNSTLAATGLRVPSVLIVARARLA
jgi:Ca2+-binding RTX toxin-like protein